ncbi:hypothetical protein GOP47_0026167 [Adiantum capillus-veneris]|uniref:protein-serine/threonine phosphatase n=1 Tax=Adiantum capillus-veneris TaxID=13818 RepID=A0A9D4U1U0_ADICA|nr:hypothetical protein GOP47_0025830 [Adiantum capillus-veneris]KAI5059848.1 hypothetical protein GOP47_0026167 [Adiantum capillus-veneris]
MSFFSACWKPVEDYIHSGVRVVDNQQDALLWHKDLTQYATGDFSIAVVQANARLEDQTQVKVGPYGTIIGVYDGHGGPEASRFITNHLFPKIEGFARDSGRMSAKVLKQAFSATEEEFLGLVDKNWRAKPHIASVGSCCLVGVISGSNLYVANLGDSRVVLGTVRHGKVVALRISQEHNACNVEVREELKAQHPDDSHIVVLKHGVWRVKGIIQVSRSIGDVYLKKPEYNKDHRFSRSGSPLLLKKPVLSAEPSLHERALSHEDSFLIFASDGLWEHMTDQEAVDMVQKGSRNGIARSLVRAALQQAAKKREMSYADLKKIEPGVRRYFHDDISVVVVYLDHSLMDVSASASKPRSRKVSMDSVNAPLDIFSSEISDGTPLV